MKYIIGVDVGLKGALCFYNPLETPIIYDMPVKVVVVNGKKKIRIDVTELARIVDLHASDCSKANIEFVSASPQMGITSAFAFGMAAGLIHGVIAANFIPIHLVRPQEWKKHFGLSSDKNESRRIASELSPNSISQFARAKDDGRAESLLIAMWGSKFNASKA